MMDRKKMIELSCAMALAITILAGALTSPHTALNKWWGVIFSPLCTSAVSADAEGEEGYILRWKSLEWLQKWFEYK